MRVLRDNPSNKPLMKTRYLRNRYVGVIDGAWMIWTLTRDCRNPGDAASLLTRYAKKGQRILVYDRILGGFTFYSCEGFCKCYKMQPSIADDLPKLKKEAQLYFKAELPQGICVPVTAKRRKQRSTGQ